MFSKCGFWTSRQITQAQEGPPHILCRKPAHRNAHCSSGLLVTVFSACLLFQSTIWKILMQRNHSSLTSAWSCQVLSSLLLLKWGGAGGGIKTLGFLAREQKCCVGKSSWVCFISYVNQFNWRTLGLKVVCMQPCQYLLSLEAKKSYRVCSLL